MPAPWPSRFDPLAWARKRGSFQGCAALSDFARLREALLDVNGDAQFRLSFELDAQGRPRATVAVGADLTLQCQRTLEAFVHRVEQESCIVFVAAGDETTEEPDGCEEWQVEGEDVSTLEVVEEELILALPLVPISEPEERSDWVHRDDEGSAPRRENPFAVLAQLKKS